MTRRRMVGWDWDPLTIYIYLIRHALQGLQGKQTEVALMHSVWTIENVSKSFPKTKSELKLRLLLLTGGNFCRKMCSKKP